MAGGQGQVGLSVLSGAKPIIQTQGVGINQPLGDYSPETQAELARAERRRQIANLLLQQGLQGSPATTQAGRFVVPMSPWQGVADLAKTAAGAYGNYAADEAGREAVEADRKKVQKALLEYRTKRYGTGGEDDRVEDLGSRANVTNALMQLQTSGHPYLERAGALYAGQEQANLAREDTQAEARQRALDAANLKRELDAKHQETQMALGKLAAGSHEKIAELPVDKAVVKDATSPTGWSYADMRTSQILMKGAPAPDTPEDKLARQGAKGGNLSATAQKELFEADDTMTASQNAKTALTRALELNDKAYEGALAGGRAAVVSNIPGLPKEGANAAVDLNNIVTGQALEQLRATFGGMPTEGERKVLLDVQGSVNMTAPQRKEVWERAIKMVERREKIAKERADQLRGGTYFKPQGGPTVPPVDLTQQRRASDKDRLKFDAQGNPVP